MKGFLYTLALIFIADGLWVIYTVGRPQDPYTPAFAATTMLLNLIVAALLFRAGTKL